MLLLKLTMNKLYTKASKPSTQQLLRHYSVPPKFTEQYRGPPKLPKHEQEEFERLQNIAQSQIAIEDYNDRLLAAQREAAAAASGSTSHEAATEEEDVKPPVVNNSDIGTFAYLKTIPEFEGEVNPNTGEVGGPKQDPLKQSDEWTYNGRTIDF